MGEFFYDDNLDVLRGRAIKDESVDLVYLDPPFNSRRNYNLIHREADGTASEAQRKAFEDYWTMDRAARDALTFLVSPGKDRWKIPVRLSETFEMLARILGSDSTMLAYLAMMGVRLVELRRVMKPTASLYLHCDPTASHYLKLVLDVLFGVEGFMNEIVWKRNSAHSDGRQGSRHFGRISDSILFYVKGNTSTWNQLYGPYSEKYIAENYFRRDPDGRLYRVDNIQGPGGAAKGNPRYEFLGVTRYWRYSRQRMQELYEQGRIVQSRPGAVPQYKRYLDEMPGVPLQNVWTDIPVINNRSKEHLGYPTQKPVALLERIIAASSNPGDLVLDPFCGCGTTIEAAEKLRRRWIGIDITHLAVSVLRRRMEDRFSGLKLKVHGEPADAASARMLAKSNPHEFQAWIVDKVGGVPLEVSDDKRAAKKGGDRGIDGIVLFRDDPKAARSHRLIVSVKGTESVNPAMVRELRGTMEREKAAMAALLLLTPPTDGMRREAKAAGKFTSEFFKAVERIQILSVDDIFAGKSLEIPGANTTHKSTPPAGVVGA